MIRKLLGKLRQMSASKGGSDSSTVRMDERLWVEEIQSQFRMLTQSGYDDRTEIGINTYIGPLCQITMARIGNYCSIAPRVLIGLGEHDPYSVSTSTLFVQEDIYGSLTKEPVEIGHDVWIGCNAVVLRGVRIGNGAIIGASAVVTHDIPPFGIAVGNPARVIKFRFGPVDISKIEQSGWWLKDLETAKVAVEELRCQLSLK